METNNVTQWAIIGAAVLVLIAGGSWLAMRGNDAAPADTDEEVSATTTPSTTTVETKTLPKGTQMATSDGETVAVSDQAAGTSVSLDGMELTRASWIAVRDDMRILGASWFPSSATSGTVKLQRATVSGKSYSVVIYVDDGDKKFDFKTDKLITVDGKPVGTSFTAN
jgi:hypothetical protein